MKKKIETGRLALLIIITAIIMGVILTGCNDFLKNKSNNEGNLTAESSTESSVQSDVSQKYPSEFLDESKVYFADIEIKNKGKITVKLDQKAAPITATNFVELANSGFYDGLTFHRIIEGFMMQGGALNKNGTGGSENTIVGEFIQNGIENNLSHTRSAISMARNSKSMDSANSQFFIVQQDSIWLDGQYAAFGYVTEGMDIVDNICSEAVPIDDNGLIAENKQPVITSIKIRTE